MQLYQDSTPVSTPQPQREAGVPLPKSGGAVSPMAPLTQKDSSSHPLLGVLVALVCVALISFVGYVLFMQFSAASSQEITSFEECVEAQNGAINLMYPPQCIGPDGTVFIDPSAEEVTPPSDTSELEEETETEVSTEIRSTSIGEQQQYETTDFSVQIPSGWSASVEESSSGSESVVFVNPEKTAGIWIVQPKPAFGWGGPEDPSIEMDVVVMTASNQYSGLEAQTTNGEVGFITFDTTGGYSVYAGSLGAIPGVTGETSYSHYLSNRSVLLKILATLSFN